MAAALQPPVYISPSTASALCSETRPVHVSDDALAYINGFLDELLFLCCSAAASHPSFAFKSLASPLFILALTHRVQSADALSSDIPATPETSDKQNAKLGLPLLTSTFSRRGLLRVMPSQVSRNAVLEGEYFTRELSKHPAFRNDKALPKAAPAKSQAAVTEVYQELSAWVQELYSAAASGTLVGGLVEALSSHVDAISLKVQARTNRPELHLTPALALYAATSVASTTDFLMELVERVIERDPSVNEATPGHVWLAVSEDQRIWDAFEHFRLRSLLERSVAVLSRKGSVGSSARGLKRQASAHTHHSAARSRSFSSSRPSFSAGAPNGQAFLGMSPSMNMSSHTMDELGEQSSDVDSSESFEQLMLSGQTMKMSLTPHRLKNNLDIPGRNRRSSSAKKDSATSMPPSAQQAPPMPAPTPSKKPPMRLQARSALHRNEASDEDEDDDLDFLDGPRRKPKKESLKDIFASDPPWATPDAGPPLPKSGGPSGSSKMARMTGMQDAPMAPASANASQARGSLSSSGPKRKMVAKDERKPPSGTKDLIEFLSSQPPPGPLVPPMPANDPRPDPAALAQKKSSRSLKSFLKRGNNESVSTETGSSKEPEPQPWSEADEANFRGVKAPQSKQEPPQKPSAPADRFANVAGAPVKAEKPLARSERSETVKSIDSSTNKSQSQQPTNPGQADMTGPSIDASNTRQHMNRSMSASSRASGAEVTRSTSKIKRVPSPKTQEADIQPALQLINEDPQPNPLPRKRYPSTSIRSRSSSRAASLRGPDEAHKQEPMPQMPGAYDPRATGSFKGSHTPHPSRDLGPSKPVQKTQAVQVDAPPAPVLAKQDASVQAEPGLTARDKASSLDVLLALRSQMAQANTPAECLGLLDQTLTSLGALAPSDVNTDLSREEAVLMDILLGEADGHALEAQPESPPELAEDKTDSEMESTSEPQTDAEHELLKSTMKPPQAPPSTKVSEDSSIYTDAHQQLQQAA